MLLRSAAYIFLFFSTILYVRLLFYYYYSFSVPPSSSLNGKEIESLMAFLEVLVGGKEMIDNLRIPLQVALLISPIFLLLDVQMHLSSFYGQRHKLVLVSVFFFIS
jgi:hypothetical protein